MVDSRAVSDLVPTRSGRRADAASAGDRASDRCVGAMPGRKSMGAPRRAVDRGNVRAGSPAAVSRSSPGPSPTPPGGFSGAGRGRRRSHARPSSRNLRVFRRTGRAVRRPLERDRRGATPLGDPAGHRDWVRRPLLQFRNRVERQGSSTRGHPVQMATPKHCRDPPGSATARRVVSASRATAGYSGTPLPKKLGIKPGSLVAFRGEPAGLPRRARRAARRRAREAARRGAARRPRRVLHPPRGARARLRAGSPRRSGPPAASGSPGRSAPPASRPTSPRTSPARSPLAHGLVDNKVCAIDETWSGLRVVFRLRDR